MTPLPLSGAPRSNVRFHNLPRTNVPYPSVVIDPSTGELFQSGSPIQEAFMDKPDLSDERMLKNVQPIPNALDLIDQIQPKKYQLDDTKYPGLKLEHGKETYGLLSGDIEKVLPGLVRDIPVPNSTSTEMLRGVNYSELIPILIQAVKEQQVQLKEQQRQIEELMTVIKKEHEFKADLRESVTKIAVELSDNDLAVLNQNIPNPSDQYTSIGFNIPSSVRSAAIRFVSLEGKVIQSMVIAERGKGFINVYTAELSRGVYTYSLFADGKLVDTKKMEINR